MVDENTEQGGNPHSIENKIAITRRLLKDAIIFKEVDPSNAFINIPDSNGVNIMWFPLNTDTAIDNDQLVLAPVEDWEDAELPHTSSLLAASNYFGSFKQYKELKDRIGEEGSQANPFTAAENFYVIPMEPAPEPELLISLIDDGTIELKVYYEPFSDGTNQLWCECVYLR